MSSWREYTKRDGERIKLEITDVLFEERTPYQEVGIFDTVAYGRALFLDGKIQSAVEDEFVYHEALVHPAMLCHPEPRRVMICGGGEGATLREVLRYRSVEQAVMVDLDAGVCAAAKTYMGDWHAGAFDDPRTTLLHEDARAYLERSTEPFDAIVVDVTDPLAGGPSYLIFTQEFYRLALSRLAPGGVISIQAESADISAIDGHLAIQRTVGTVFPVSRAFHTHVPSFSESWGFVVGCKERADGKAADPAALTVEQVNSALASRGISGLRFYDGMTHRRLFSPPLFERRRIQAGGPIITDANPLVIS